MYQSLPSQASFTQAVQAGRQAQAWRDSLVASVDRRNADRLATLLRQGRYNEAGLWGTMIPHDPGMTSYVDPNRASTILPYVRVKPQVTYKLASWHEPRKPRKARLSLTPDTRQLLKLTVDMRRREVVQATDALQASVGRLRRETPEDIAARMNRLHDPEAWRGLTTVREARHSDRGASGIRGVRGLASRVSVRDNHKPVTLLLPLNVVGVATIPAHASTADITAILTRVRMRPLLATVLVREPGKPSRIVPVSDYREVREARKLASVAPRQSDSVRLASVIGYTGNVD